MGTAAVIVTFNKLALLKNCLQAIQCQTTQPDEIIVVNNSSTDGTQEWLETQSQITTVQQPNLGSGGGQCTGIQTALDRGHDWVWSMDDDGVPAPDALEQLLLSAEQGGLDCVNSLVVATEDPDILSFELLPGLKTREQAIEAAEEGLIHGASNPFNGLLISRRLIDKSGNVRPELFIWGDEMEFQWRLQKAGFRMATCVRSIHVHPKDKFVRRKILLGALGSMRVPPPSRRCYFYYRNQSYIYSHYGVRSSLARFLIKGFIHAITTRQPLQQVDLYFRGISDGLKADFSKNAQYAG